MQVPFIDLNRINSFVVARFKTELDRLFDRSDYILSEAVSRFESSYCKYIGCKYSVGVNSGTDAIFLSLKALGVCEGDEVITTAFSFAATLEPILQAGAVARFVDIDQYLSIDASLVEKEITKKTKVILPVDLFGNPADLPRLRKIADQHHLKIVEDAAQAHGARIGNKKTGTISDLACFSFYPTKILGTIGDGGIITTNNEELALKLRKLRNHGGISKNQHEFVGYCSRLDSLQAIFLDIKLGLLEEYIERNKGLVKIYDENLRAVTQVTTPVFKEGSNYFLYSIKTDRAPDLAELLKKNGIGTFSYYPYILPELFGNSFEKSRFRNALDVKGKLLSLPLYPYLTSEQVKYVCDTIKTFFTRHI